MRVVVAVTGASGAAYAKRLLEALKEAGAEVHLIMSSEAEGIVREELGTDPSELAKLTARYYREEDLWAPFSSGSFKFDAMVIVPCSMKTLAAVASGYANDLIARAADVALKEGRKLVLVVRETPLNLIHIKNMERAAVAGAIILPACPAFYHKPESIEDLVDYVVGKVLDVLGIEHELFKRWGGR